MRRDKCDRLVDPRRRALVAHRVARPVHHVEHLARVGQRHDQRVVAPHLLVGHVHARLLAAQRGRQRPVHVHVGHRPQQIPAPAPPQLGPDRVDALHQLDHVGLGEAPREVARRRRTRDQFRAQRIHVRRVVAQAVQILQPRAPAQQVVRDVKHVVRLVVRQASLQEVQPGVDLQPQPQPRHQPPHGADAPEAHRARPRPDLVVDRARREHGLRPRPPASRPAVPRPNLPLPPGTVPPALVMRYSLHRKGLLVGTGRPLPESAIYNQDRSFRYSLTGVRDESRLSWG